MVNFPACAWNNFGFVFISKLLCLEVENKEKLDTEFLFKTASSELTCRKIDHDISFVWSLI